MSKSLSTTLRNDLRRFTLAAREAAEKACPEEGKDFTGNRWNACI